MRHQPGELHDPHIPGLLRPEGEDLLRESQAGAVVSEALSQEEERVRQPGGPGVSR